VQYSICDFIIDIVQNSVEAKANVITLKIEEIENTFAVSIGDDGCGMDKETLEKVKDPFYTDGKKHEKRKVGLGIPFLIQATEACEGKFDIKSNPEMGTSVYFSFDLSNVDCPTTGDIPGTLLSLMTFEGDYELMIHHSLNDEFYAISRSELIDALGEIQSAESLILAKKFLVSKEEELSEMEA